MPRNELIISPCSSTDSELKLWNVESGQCVRTYKGHVNEKNFVGLTVNRNFIACGKWRGIPWYTRVLVDPL